VSTALVWFRRDLRLHDHPPLTQAAAAHDCVLPVFVLDPALLGGRFPSPSRTAFLLACLEELDAGLRARGAGLAVRRGRPAGELAALARGLGADAVYWSADVSPYARARDRAVGAALQDAGVRAVPAPGNFAADVSAPRTQAGKPYTLFTPFWKAWEALDRRPVLPPAGRLELPPGVELGALPEAGALGAATELAAPLPAGEAAARAAMERWLAKGIDGYADRHDRLAGGTSALSPFLRFGCLSARELEAAAMDRRGAGPATFRRQLAWRDFYAHVLLRHPGNAREAFQPKYRALAWADDDAAFAAWTAGQTGYPVVDAGMRQLPATGWMHNRARMIAGSFLTKDLHLDWRRGEAHFMRYLLDGDEASNNGRWQWIASVGVDPAPYFRRMFNPVLQQQKFDPGGEYVRRWVPELAAVPDDRLAEPWRMSPAEQERAGCAVGRDYPEPIVNHRRERERALERYRAAAGG
jgi:deoxyribodipyrimidine photo-lyase